MAFLLLVWYEYIIISLFVVYSPFYGLIDRHKQYIKRYFVLCQNFLRVFSCIVTSFNVLQREKKYFIYSYDNKTNVSKS